MPRWWARSFKMQISASHTSQSVPQLFHDLPYPTPPIDEVSACRSHSRRRHACPPCQRCIDLPRACCESRVAREVAGLSATRYARFIGGCCRNARLPSSRLPHVARRGGRSVGRSLGRSVDRSIGRAGGGRVGRRLVGRSAGRPGGRKVARSARSRRVAQLRSGIVCMHCASCYNKRFSLQALMRQSAK